MRGGKRGVILVVRRVWCLFLLYFLLRFEVLYTSSGLYHSFNAADAILSNVSRYCMTNCDLSSGKDSDTVNLRINNLIGSDAFT